MTFTALLLVAVALAMDAFTVAVGKGLSMGRAINVQAAIVIGLWFGVFQALMPVLGFLLAFTFREAIMAFDHWIAFGLLVLIGANMIRAALTHQDDDTGASLDLQPRMMLPLAIATSIDALAVGVSFAFLDVHIGLAAAVIGVVTFAISVTGVKIGSVFGARFEKPAEIAGGVILILLGTKILLEHLEVLG